MVLTLDTLVNALPLFFTITFLSHNGTHNFFTSFPNSTSVLMSSGLKGMGVIALVGVCNCVVGSTSLTVLIILLYGN
jgi:hypothetical protein